MPTQVAEKKAKKPTLTTEAKAYVTAAASVIKSSYQQWGAPREFEKLICSCSPHRKELEDIKEQELKAVASIDKRIVKLQNERKAILDPFQPRKVELNRIIQETDRKEHPQAERIYRQSKEWIRLWLTENLLAGNDLGPTDGLYQKYTEAVAAGWRPKPPENVVND